MEFDDEQQQSYEEKMMNLRLSECLNEMTSDPRKTSVTIQDVDRESMKYLNNDKHDPSWAAQEGSLFFHTFNLNLISGMRSTGMSMNFFVRRVVLGLTHTAKLLIKN